MHAHEANLCPPCRSIFFTNDKAHHDHHLNASDLLGCECQLCKNLVESWRNASCPLDEAAATQSTGKGFVNFKFHVGLDGSTDSAPLTILFTVLFPNRPQGTLLRDNLFYRQKVLVIPAVEDVEEVSLITDTPQDTNTGSSETWKIATHWLSQCNLTHPKCSHKPEQSSRLPTRLLDVGTTDSNDPSIHLHITDSSLSAPSTPYTTLSHCWGKITIKQLKKENLNSFTLNGIKISDLPKTFQDAIMITRRLGVRYLWIDSLCILQDCPVDWAAESSRMGSVYADGFLNIAATGAPDGNTGCFLERDLDLARRFRVWIPKGKMSKFKMKEGLYDLVPHSLWEDGVSNAPLNRRGWVAQERILARRVLHFSSNQLFWECNELDACEMYPLGAPPILSSPSRERYAPGAEEFGFSRLHFKNLDAAAVRAEVHVSKIPWTFALVGPLASGPSVDPYYVWNKILISYTKCALTKERDKLVAISAVAKLIQPMADDEYLAGLWRTFLPYHLLWFVDPTDPNRVRTDEYVAPSWSWASMKTGRIEPYVYIRPDGPVMIQILDTRTYAITKDMMGQVSGGYIKLRGWLKKFSIVKGKQPSVLGIERPQLSDAVQLDENRKFDEQEVWFLPILSLGPWLENEAFGLLLVETGKKENEFRRVGRFRAPSDVAGMFRRPTYPIEVVQGQITQQKQQNDAIDDDRLSTGSERANNDLGVTENIQSNDVRGTVTEMASHNSKNSKSEKKWSFGFWKKTTDKNSWVEHVITII